MVFFEKSQPAPTCLEHEKTKAKGDYKCGDVLPRLKSDFKNKCYICELKKPTNINVEHFIPHKGDKDLKFDWDNLFWSCSHCNNTKLDKYDNILNCTDANHKVEENLRYKFKPFPLEKVEIEPLDNSDKIINTKELLLAVYNGTTTPLKKLESANLRNKLLEEIKLFQQNLIDYFNDTNDANDKAYFLRKIKRHLNTASSFTAFKRWIVRENEGLFNEFKQYLEP
jgi:hypothetical protein